MSIMLFLPMFIDVYHVFNHVYTLKVSKSTSRLFTCLPHVYFGYHKHESVWKMTTSIRGTYFCTVSIQFMIVSGCKNINSTHSKYFNISIYLCLKKCHLLLTLCEITASGSLGFGKQWRVNFIRREPFGAVKTFSSFL